jgi:hypothetical protein
MIMQISNVYVQNGAAEWAKKAAAEDSHAKEKNTPKKAGKTVLDQVSISADAGKSSSSEALVRARADALPEIREEKIVVAKERTENGYYNTPEFSSKLAENLVES